MRQEPPSTSLSGHNPSPTENSASETFLAAPVLGDGLACTSGMHSGADIFALR